MEHIYNGTFTSNQIKQMKKSLRGSIFFLLLCVDPETCSEYSDIDVEQCFEGLMYKVSGFNELLFCPLEVVTAMSLLQAALLEYEKENFNFHIYRKLILDAGAEVAKIKEV